MAQYSALERVRFDRFTQWLQCEEDQDEVYHQIVILASCAKKPLNTRALVTEGDAECKDAVGMGVVLPDLGRDEL